VVTKHHHTLKVSLTYLVKYKSVKSVNIFGTHPVRQSTVSSSYDSKHVTVSKTNKKA